MSASEVSPQRCAWTIPIDASFKERGAMVWMCTDNLVVHHHVNTVFPLDSPVKSERQRIRQQQSALVWLAEKGDSQFPQQGPMEGER